MQREFTSYYQARCFLDTLDRAWLLMKGTCQEPIYLVTDDENLVEHLRGRRYITQCMNDPTLFDETFLEQPNQ